MKKKICVVGGGISGLAAIKSCLEEDLEVICYEKTDSFGGVWVYREELIPGVGSVTKGTILNTSKEMSAFSDFPPPRQFANYMHNSKMVRSYVLVNFFVKNQASNIF